MEYDFSSPDTSPGKYNPEPSSYDVIGSNEQNNSFGTSIVSINSSAKDEEVGQQYEEILTRIGGFGKYQQLIVCFVFLPMIFAASFMQSCWLFIAATPIDHWCRIPLTNISKEQEVALLPFGGEDAGDYKHEYPDYSQCRMYAVNYSAEVEKQGDINGLIEFLNQSRHLLNETECEYGWNYDQTISGKSTIVSEFGLVCADGFLTTLAYIMSCVGGSIGIPLGGYFSDRIGRKRSYFVFLFFYLVLGVASCAVHSYIVFVVLIGIQNIAANPIYFIPYMAGIEILVPEARSTFSVLLTISFTLGSVAFTGTAYFVRDGWRFLLFSSTAPFALCFLYWFAMPESPRWLLSVGKYADAEHFLRRAAYVNGLTFDPVCELMYLRLTDCYATAQRKATVKPNRSVSWLDLFRSPNLRRKTLFLTYLGCSVNLCYTGLNYYAPSLGTNPYLSFLLVDVIELPASFLTQAVADRLGRRLTMVLCFILGSVACLSTVFVPNYGFSAFPVLLTLFLTAKMFCTSGFTIQELIVYELYPTSLRGVGVSFTNIIGYLFSSLGPVVVGLRTKYTHFSMIAFGVASIGGVFCIMSLPETLHYSLPETSAEAEAFGRNSSCKDCLRLWPRSKSEIEADNNKDPVLKSY